MHLRETMRKPLKLNPASWYVAVVAALLFLAAISAIPASGQSANQNDTTPPANSSAGAAAPGRQASGAPVSPLMTATYLVPTVRPDPKRAKEAYEQGVRAEKQRDWDSAFNSYSDAVNFAPDNRDYLFRREMARGRLVQERVDAAEREAVAGHIDKAQQQLLAASHLDPTNKTVRERLTELSSPGTSQIVDTTEPELAGEVHFDYRTGQQSFDYRGDTTGAYERLAQQFGLEVAFDVDVKGRQVRLQLDSVDFPTAARLLGDATGTFWRPLTRNLFFVTDDTPQKRRDYDVSVVRSILLPGSETPDQMTETLRVVRDITGITRSELDPNSRTLTLRASPQAVAVATDLVHQLEQPVGELVLEIEVLEVDRTYARQLGITPPQTATAYSFSQQQIQLAESSSAGLLDVIEQVFGSTAVPPLVAFGGGLSTYLATLPGASANFSEMLTLVHDGRRILLRAEDGKPATFFVGDRYPVSLAQYSSSLETGSSTGVSTSGLPIANFAAGNSPSFITNASLRDNGIDDLMVANSADNTVSVLLGNGDGTFATQVTYPTGVGPVSITTGQFDNATTAANNNTSLDMAVANKTANTISILLANGDGTFQPKTDIPAGSAPVSVVAANFHDVIVSNETDLAVANQGDNTISIYTGNGDGTFKTPAIIQLPTGFEPSSLAALDLNADGHIDLVVSNEGNNSVSVFLGNGNGTFQPRTDYPTGASPVFVALGAFGANGAIDIAVADHDSNAVTVYFNQITSAGTPTGTFVSGTTRDFPAGNGPTSIVAADVNLDGLPDMVVSDQTDNAVSILINLGSETFATNYELPVGTAPVSITTADFNADGRPDVATANNGSADATVVLNSTSLFGGVLGGSNGEAVPFPGVEYLDVGLKIKATPRIHPGDDVTLQMSFDLSSLAGQSQNTIPVINNQTVDQTVRLKENQTGLVASFQETQLMNSINGTPGLADVPGAGSVLSDNTAQNQDNEVLILVTPRMVRLAPRKDHVVYAGQGSLDRAGASEGPITAGNPRERPAENGPPATPPQQAPAEQQPQQPPSTLPVPQPAGAPAQSELPPQPPVEPNSPPPPQTLPPTTPPE
jgi:Bacterial type II and III secretion system protein/FG-GAP-like repeat